MLSAVALVAQLTAMIAVFRAPDAHDCPDTDQFVARIERITRGPIAAREGTTLRVDFSRTSNAFEAKVKLAGALQGERALRDESPTCDALADAVAVTTVLLLDPAWRPMPSENDATPRAPSWWSLWVSGRVGAGAGLVGGPSWLLGGGLEVWLGPLTTVSLAGTTSGSRATELGGGAVDVGLWYVELAAFRSLTGETFKLGPSLEVMGGVLHGAGAQYPVTSSASLPWFALGAGIRADIGIGAGLRVGARSHLVIPTRKHSFSVGYVGTAYESSAVAAVADLVLEMRLW